MRLPAINPQLKKKLIRSGLALLVMAAILYQYLSLKKAHSSFEDFAAYRGCTNIIEANEGYKVCKTKKGTTETLVEFDHKWYLKEDLPCGFLCF